MSGMSAATSSTSRGVSGGNAEVTAGSAEAISVARQKQRILDEINRLQAKAADSGVPDLHTALENSDSDELKEIDKDEAMSRDKWLGVKNIKKGYIKIPYSQKLSGKIIKHLNRAEAAATY